MFSFCAGIWPVFGAKAWPGPPSAANWQPCVLLPLSGPNGGGQLPPQPWTWLHRKGTGPAQVSGKDEAEALLNGPNETTPLGLRDRAILETLYGGGLRVGELVDPNLTDLNLARGQLRVMGKGRRERICLVEGGRSMPCSFI